jgi:hypothetical protein
MPPPPPRTLATSLGLAVLVTLVALPALRGTWVYDDQILPHHGLLDDAGDLLATFARTSRDYFAWRTPTHDPLTPGATYRPAAMFTLLVGNLLGGHTPFAHHAISLGLHLATLAAVGLAARRRAPLVWLAPVTALLALHPAPAEAWLWINGRADLQAGLSLALLAFALDAVRGAARVPVLGALTAFGCLSKETFALTSASVVAAHTLGRPRAERSLHGPVAWGLGCGAFLGLRAWAMRAVDGAVPPSAPGQDLARAGTVVGRALEALLLPSARGMRLLEWEVTRPPSLTTALALVATAALALWLLRARRLAPLALLAGAVASMLPLVFVARGFWLGLDRYTYQPAVLAALGLTWAGAPIEVTPTLRRAGLALAGVSLGLAVACFETAGCYASQDDFGRCMIELRPDEPTGYAVAATTAFAHGDRVGCDALFAAMPRATMPPGLAHAAQRVLLARGHLDDAEAVVRAGLRLDPLRPQLTLDLLDLAILRARWDDVARLADRSLALRVARPRVLARRVAAALDRALAHRDLPPDARARLACRADLARGAAPRCPR